VELPRVEELWKKYRDRGFSAVAIEANRDHEGAVKFIEEKGLTMHMLENGEEKNIVADQFLVNGFPTTFIIDSEGRIIFYHLGYSEGDEKTLEAEILKLLGE
jgi:peroxiredoxin